MPIVEAPIMYFIGAAIPISTSEVAVHRFKLGPILLVAIQEAWRRGFSSRTILRSAPPPSPQDLSASPPHSFPYTLKYPTSTHHIPQVNSFSGLNSDTPISTTFPDTYPSSSLCRTMQPNRSTPPSSTASSATPSSFSPHKRTFVCLLHSILSRNP